jgi:thiol-disulfide isomerase/thioredoxin
MNDYQKYLKYKMKYIELKNNLKFKQTGGNKNEKPELYLFKASWCGHCKAFMNTWETLNNDKELKEKIDFVMYDSDKDKNQMKKFNIQGYPTLLFKNDKNLIEFDGNRTFNDIKNFINKNLI